MDIISRNPDNVRKERIIKVALALTPAFRDKFDFSKAEDYDSLVEHGFKAAEAFVKKEESLK